MLSKHITAVQRQITVTAYFTSKSLLLVAFAGQIIFFPSQAFPADTRRWINVDLTHTASESDVYGRQILTS